MKDRWPNLKDYQAKKVYEAEGKHISEFGILAAGRELREQNWSRKHDLLTVGLRPSGIDRFIDDIIRDNRERLTNIQCRRFIRKICQEVKITEPRIALGTNRRHVPVATEDEREKLKFKRDTAFGQAELIFLPRWAKTKQTICHEMAHVITDQKGMMDGHGPNFCGVYLHLVKKFVGLELYKQLEDSFKSHKVDFNKNLAAFGV